MFIDEETYLYIDKQAIKIRRKKLKKTVALVHRENQSVLVECLDMALMGHEEMDVSSLFVSHCEVTLRKTDIYFEGTEMYLRFDTYFMARLSYAIAHFLETGELPE